MAEITHTTPVKPVWPTRRERDPARREKRDRPGYRRRDPEPRPGEQRDDRHPVIDDYV